MKEKSNKKLKAMFALGAIFFGAGLYGCGGSGPHIAGDHLTAWYDVYGNFCHYGDPTSGCNFYSNGQKVIDIEDPYFSCCYNLEFDVWAYYDSYGHYQTYVGYGWISNSGILYDEWGIALNKEKEEVGSDLVADVGEAKEKVIRQAGASFAKEHNLQADVGMAWARGLNKAMELRLGRSRSESELNTITKSLTGISFKRGEAALRKVLATNNASALETLNEEMARHMRTTASNSRKIIEGMYGKQIEAFENAQKSGEKLSLYANESDAHKQYLESDEFKAAVKAAEKKSKENSDVFDDVDGEIL